CDLRGDLCLYSTGVDVLVVIAALGGLWVRRSRCLLVVLRPGRRQFRVQDTRGGDGHARDHRRHRPCRRAASGRRADRAPELCGRLCRHRRSTTRRGGGFLGDDETDVGLLLYMLYNGTMMNAIETENVVIGVLAGIGVIVLLVMFVYVVKRMIKEE